MITTDPRDKYFEKLKKLKGVTYQGRGFYIIPAKLLQGSVGIQRYREVKKRTNRYELSAMGDLVGWGSGHEHQNDYRLKDWEEAMKETNNISISSKLTEAANSIMNEKYIGFKVKGTSTMASGLDDTVLRRMLFHLSNSRASTNTSKPFPASARVGEYSDDAYDDLEREAKKRKLKNVDMIDHSNGRSVRKNYTEAANSIMEVHNNTPNYKEVAGHTEVEFVLDGKVIASKFYLTKDRIHQKFIKLWMDLNQTPDGKFHKGTPTTRINGKMKH